jgi:hypothetical protein
LFRRRGGRMLACYVEKDRADGRSQRLAAAASSCAQYTTPLGACQWVRVTNGPVWHAGWGDWTSLVAWADWTSLVPTKSRPRDELTATRSPNGWSASKTGPAGIQAAGHRGLDPAGCVGRLDQSCVVVTPLTESTTPSAYAQLAATLQDWSSRKPAVRVRRTRRSRGCPAHRASPPALGADSRSRGCLARGRQPRCRALFRRRRRCAPGGALCERLEARA